MSNTPKIGDRIKVLKSELKYKTDSELEKGKDWPHKRVLSNGLLADWLEKPIGWSSDKLEKFLDHYSVNREWWRTGQGDVLVKNGTSVHNEPAVKGNAMEIGEAIRVIIEGSEYYVIPKVAIEGKYKLMPLEEIEKDTKMMDWLMAQNEKYADKIFHLESQASRSKESDKKP